MMKLFTLGRCNRPFWSFSVSADAGVCHSYTDHIAFGDSTLLGSCEGHATFQHQRQPGVGFSLQIGPRRIHTVRVRGGNKKYRALRLDVGNFSWGSECKYVVSLLHGRETCAGLQFCCRVEGCKHGFVGLD